MSINYYDKLRALKDGGRLTMRLVIAPPRTGSTMVAVALSDDFYVHEPFLRFGYSEQDSNSSYKNIYEEIGGAEFESSGRSASIVVKELTHRIALNKEYLKLVELSCYPPLFLIRNPLLTAESRVRKIVETIPTKARETTYGWLKAQLTEKPPEELSLESQQRLLDLYAKEIGYTDWSALVAECINNQNYTLLEGILASNLDRLAIDLSGEASLEGQVNRLAVNGKKVFILDSTELRLDPKGTMQGICSSWGIEYRKSRVSWGERRLELRRGTRTMVDLDWYDSLANSEGVKIPTEVPPSLGGLPSFIRRDLVSSGLPQYIRLFNSGSKIKGDIRKINRDLASELGLSRERFTIADIDPVFAVLINPELLNEQEYLEKYKEQSELIDIVRMNIGNEGDFRGRRK